ncbi:PREDICTED: 40S ribosomal protein S15-like [Populus euphratica]|uniref:40S ribosomal protein S15-like n=1 Tax=Populus euphratica TaxID=75702 RepID=A0AAJ6UMU6_POPEU|nr:PREDICTED: 40S ribosomal protein S15-like [Populus euphratica]
MSGGCGDGSNSGERVAKEESFQEVQFRGVDLGAFLDMSTDVLVKLFPAGAGCRFQRGVKRKPMTSIMKLRKAVRKGRPGWGEARALEDSS